MSIYTITLKREPLALGESWADAASLPGEPEKQQANQRLANEGGRALGPELFGSASIDESSSTAREASPYSATDPASEAAASVAASVAASGQAKEEAKLAEKPDWESNREEQQQLSTKHATTQQQQQQQQQNPLQSPIKHSVNVTLEIQADLKEPSRIVWLRNNQQLTSSEQPVLFVRRRNNSNNCVDITSTTTTQQETTTTTTTSTTHSTQLVSAERRLAGVYQQQLQQESQQETGELEKSEQVALERKCVQEADKKGSRLTIFDIQNEDYGQYTCKLIGADGGELKVDTQLRLEDKTSLETSLKQQEELVVSELERPRRPRLEVRLTMDEVIEVKEGDLNIEMGIQVLPEMNEDDGQELMSEEEKREFIAGTTVSWFKDDEKLRPGEPEVERLYQFSYDPNEAFHKLVVRRATKETEGVYTCVVENESGTSSCCTQLVVGPGNKPKLGSRLEDMSVYAGQSLEFRLKSTGSNRIDSCQWFRDDVLLEGAKTGRSELADGTLVFSLRLENIKLDDSGRYKCRVSNEYGYDETQCTVRVLQEVIEEHEMVEEHVTESTHIESQQSGTGKRKSSMEEEEEYVEETKDEAMKVDRISSAAGKKPRFLIPLEDTEAYLGETVVMRVALDESVQIDNLRFLKDDSLIYSSRRDETTTTTTDRRMKVRTYTETIQTHVEQEEEEEAEQVEHWKRRASNRLARFYEITIERVSEESMGTWSCEAENSFGKATCKAELDVFAEPRIVRDLDEKVRASPATEIRLTVDASGSPKPVYSWFKDGIGIAEEEERLFTETRDKRSTTTTTTTTTTTRRRSSTLGEDTLQSVTGETLVIRNASPEDAGVYTCKVENRLGQVCSRKCRLTVIGHGDDLNSAPRIIKDFSTDQVIQVDEEENVTLRILAEGHPKPSQVWYKDTEEIVERTTRFQTETSGQEYQLKIIRSKASDSGRYQVLLRNEHGETRSKTVEVRVNKVSPDTESQRRPSAPTIQLDSQDKVVGPKSNVSFDVQVGGHPKPFVTWYKNGRRMTESSDGRISFVEEETITTIIEEEIDSYTGEVRETVRKESSTIHRLVINDVRELDEAIYSLKAENDLGSCKSSLVSLTIDRRKEATDEIREREEQQQSNKRNKLEESVVEETTVTTTTTTKTTDERENEELESERHHQKRSNLTRRTSEISEDDEEEDGRKKSTKRTTRTTTRTTTTTTQEEEEEADEDRLRRKRLEEEEKEEEEEEREKLNKRRTVVEEIEDEVEEEQLIERKNIRREEVVEEQEVEEETKTRTEMVEEMEVDEVEEERQRIEEERRRSRTQSSRRSSEQLKELERRRETETLEKRRRAEEEEEQEEKTKSKREIREEEEEEVVQKRDRKPRIVSAPKKVEAGLGSSPELEVIVETTTVVEEEEETVTWLKNGNPIPDRILRERHIEFSTEDESSTGTKRHILKINNLRSSDAGKYKLSVSNKYGKVETEDIELEVERSMRPGQRPSITPADCRPNIEPTIRSIPEEVVAGMGSSPQVVAEVSGVPEPKLSWFKDGQPIEPRPGSHVEVIDLPTDKPDTVKQALRINNVKPVDAAAYHVKAENPAGEVESEPTNLRIDRSMGPREEPVVTMPIEATPMEVTEEIPDKPQKQIQGKLPRLPLEERILDAPLGSQATMSMPVLGKFDKAEWLKDGEPLNENDKDVIPEETGDGTQKLHFKDLKPKDAGAYTVRATNEFGTAQSAPIRILPSTPRILSQPKEVKAGVGASPVLETEVESVPDAEVEWLKDGEPIPARLLRDGHIEPTVEKTDQPGVAKHALKINEARPSDAADYTLKVENPAGEAVSEPIKLNVDRSMKPYEEPIVEGLSDNGDKPIGRDEPSREKEPSIVSMPREIVAGPGSSPSIVAEVSGNPLPDITWHKDGQPITPRQLRDGHLVIEELPTDKPDTVRQALKIDNVKPLDAAAYHLKAENPLGAVESEPTNLRLDRTMGPREEPTVTMPVEEAPMQVDSSSDERPTKQAIGKLPLVPTEERILDAPLGSQASMQIPVGGKFDKAEWLKDGKPLDERDKDVVSEERPDGTQVLKLKDVKPTDAGAYTVRATNQFGIVESAPIKILPFAPQILSQPKEVKAGVGASPVLEATLQSVPEAKVQWLKDDEPIPARLLRDGHVEPIVEKTDQPGVVKHALKINEARPSDASNYTLKAENPAGEAVSEPIKLTVDRSMGPRDEPIVEGLPDDVSPTKSKPVSRASSDEKAPVILSIPEEVVAGIGSSPQVVAEVSGVPEPKLSWFKDGQPIEPRPGSHVEVIDLPTDKPDTVKQALKINNVKPVDAAAYHVKAENAAGEVESEPTNLRIDRSMGPREEPVVTIADQPVPMQVTDDVQASPEKHTAGNLPRLSIEERILEVPIGAYATMEMPVLGKFDKAEWLKDGKPIDLQDNHLIPEELPDGTQKLQIKGLKPKDVGAYTVRAANEFGTAVSAPIKVVTGVPQILSQPKEVKAGVGSSPVLEAQIESVPDAEVEWLKNGEPIPARLLRDGHVEPIVEETGQPGTVKHALKINQARPSDAADYSLKAENPAGEAVSEPIKLKLDRSMSASDEPIETRIGEPVAPRTEQQGSSTPTAPEVVSQPEEVVAGPGSSPCIVAEVSGNPLPDVTWHKDGQPITARQLRDGHLEIENLPTGKPDTVKQALKINNVKPIDAAAYHVKAENPLGEIESEPTNLRIDRTMGPREEPIVKGLPQPDSLMQVDSAGREDLPQKQTTGKLPLLPAEERTLDAPLGSQATMEIPVKGKFDKAEWLKDGRPLDDSDKDVIPEEKPDGTQVLKFKDIKPTDAAAYTVRATNEFGTAVSAPIKIQPFTPRILSQPKEVKAGVGSSPVLEAKVESVPDAKVEWLKDGEPIPARLLRDGHIEPIVEKTDQPGVAKHALKINEARPSDTADYTLKAENPAGEAVSEPIKLTVDRSMSPREEPIVEGLPDEDIAALSTSDLKPQKKPSIVSMPEEVVVGPGGNAEIVGEVSGVPLPNITWHKDGQPITPRQLRDGHLVIEELPTDKPDTVKQALKINDAKPLDAAAYHVKAENPLGQAESEPTNLRLDRTMGPREEAVVKGLPEDESSKIAPTTELKAPEVVSLPEEIVAGRGSNPAIVAEVSGTPLPEVSWFKDGEPITPAQLKDGHLEIENIPTDKPDVVKQALKINNLKPVDAAAYQIKAENPEGQIESQPINLRVDRTMGPREEPLVTMADQVAPMEVEETENVQPTKQTSGKLPRLPVEERILDAPLGSKASMQIPVEGKFDKAEWLKDGKPLDERDKDVVSEEKPDGTQVLKLKDVKPTDAGAYTVRASNEFGTVESAPIKILPFAPQILSQPKEVKVGVGASPELETKIESVPDAKVEWLKDGEPIPARSIRDGHIVPIEEQTEQPGVVKHGLKINEARPSDAANYTLKASNPGGEAVSEPIKLTVDRSMSPREEPIVEGLPDDSGAGIKKDEPSREKEPSIVSMPREIVAGPGSSPSIVAEVSGNPLPDITWHKDGQPITARQLRDGHLVIEELPTDKSDTVKQALKIDNVKPLDAAAYHVKAENPLGAVESEPTNLRLDRTMGPREEPTVTMPVEEAPMQVDSSSDERPTKQATGKLPLVPTEERILDAPLGSQASMQIPVGGKFDKAEWLKDGKPLDERDKDVVSEEKPDGTQVLKLKDVKPTDAGAYTVRATNEYGTAESAPVRILPFMPRILSQPKDVKVGVGASPILETMVESIPDAKVEWLKDGEPIPARLLRDGHIEPIVEKTDQPGVVKHALKINEARPSDASKYTLKAENPAGEAVSEPIKLSVDRSMSPRDEPIIEGLPDDVSPTKSKPVSRASSDEKAPVILSIPEEVVAGIGSSPQVVAEVSGVPEPKLIWFKDGQPIEPRPGSHVEVIDLPTDKPDTVKQALRINNVKPVDAAAYHVKAENPAGEVESEPTNLRIDRSMGPREEPVVTMPIEATPMEVTEEIPDKPQKQIQGKPPQLPQQERILDAPLGSQATMAMPVLGKFDKAEWLKDGKPLDEKDKDLIVEEAPDGTQKLHFKDVKPTDVGAYTVRASNEFGTAESAPIRILPALPIILSKQKEVKVGVGSNPVLEMTVESVPDAKVEWLKDGEPIPSRLLTNSHIQPIVEKTDKPGVVKQVLKINDARPSDAAKYTLRAENPAGEAVSEPIKLIVDRSMGSKDEPIVEKVIAPLDQDTAHDVTESTPIDETSTLGNGPCVVSLPDEIVVGPGADAVIVAEITGNPLPEISWHKDGQPITSRQLRDGHLVIENLPTDKPDTVKQALKICNVKPVDVAAYHVRAENPIGEAVSHPTNLRIDRSMGPHEEPIQTITDSPTSNEQASTKSPVARFAPRIVSFPKEIVTGPGSNVTILAEVSGLPLPEISWLKADKPLTPRQLRDGHFVIESLPSDKPDTVRQVLRIDNVKPEDAAAYHIKAQNPEGEAVSQPTNLVVDCNMGPQEEPLQTSTDQAEDGPKTEGESPRKRRAPVIVRMPRQVVAAPESTATIVVEVSGVPVPEIIWYRNGKPISKRQLSDGHFVIENLPTDKPDTVKQVLKIVGVRPEDAAAYHVKAENPAGEVVSEPTNLVVDTSMEPNDKQQVDEGEPIESPKKKKMRAPVIKRLPRKIVAGLGSSPVIEVEVTGEPKPEIIWFKNGRRLREVTNHITFEDCDNGVYRLSFIDVKMTDQAEYTFIARNELGEIESEPIHLVVDRGLGKDSEPVVQMNSGVPMGDENGPPQAPKIIGLDQDKEVMVGETVKLEAEVVGNPKPEIRWLKDGDQVELNIINEVPDSNVHSLTLKNVNDIYDGVYSLEASNPLGVARKDAKLRVKQPTETTPVQQQPSVQVAKEKPREEKPFIKKGLKFSQVNQGRSIKFEVQIDGDYDEVIWMKDGEQINGVAGEMSTEEEKEEVEEVEETTTEESTTTTSAGRPAGKRGFAPKIIRRPRNIVAGPGSRIAFEVRCTGEPKPEVRWYRNGELIRVSTSSSDQQDEGKVTFEDLDDGQLLIIEDLCETDVGSYHVVVENVYGSETTEPVQLQVESSMPASDDLANTSATTPLDATEQGKPRTGRRPRFLIRPRAVAAPKGSTIVFECQVTGEPKPVINWFRDGRIITTSSDGHVKIEEFSSGLVRLILSDISEQDVGLYHVEAENKLGSERTIPVTLEVQPEGEPVVFMTGEGRDQQMDESKRVVPQGGRPPRIVLRPRQVLVRPGATIELEVCVSGHSKPELIWYKNKQQVHTSTSSSSSSSTGEHITIEEQVNRGSVSYQKLVIRNANTKDAGQYTVSACNDFGMAYGEPVEVIVSESCSEDVETTTEETTTTEQTTTTTTTTTTTNTVFYEKYVNDGTDDSEEAQRRRRAPNFRLVPRNKKAPVGGTVTLECQVSGVPKPEVIWYKNGRRIHEQADGRVRVEEFSDGGSRLVLEQLEESDDAQYACEAINRWGRTRSDEVHLRVVEKREISEFTETSQRGSAKVTTKTTKTRSHYTFSEEKHHSGRWETLTLKDAQLDHDGDYKLIVRNKWGEASTQAPLVVIPQVEPRGQRRGPTGLRERSDSGHSGASVARRTPIEELEDYGHDLDKQVGTFGSESHYQSGEDTYLLQLRDTEFPLRLRKYLRFGANQSASLRSSLMDAHWGAGARVTVRERRRFQEIMDEEIEDEKRDESMRPMRIQREVGTCGYAAAQLEHLRLEAAERQARKSAEPSTSGAGGTASSKPDMMPPFFREKIKDAVVEESSVERSQVAVFSCLAVGEPAPEYTWFRNDIVITDWQRLQIVPRPDGGSELHITNPRLNDAACFKCVARNVHGNVTCRARLRIGATPSRPEPPEYVSVGARELFLEWRAPRDFDASAPEVLGYKLEMSRSSLGEPDSWQVLAADVGHQYYLVDDLEPATSYSFRISARNKFGWSDTSYSTYVTTARCPGAGDQPGATDADQSARISVPFVVRERQCTADIVDAHLLRYCEDDKQPQLDYQIEQSPVRLETQTAWPDQYKLQAEIARGRFSVIAKAVSKSSGQQVALKALLSSEMTKAQTKNEFDILRSLQHEKIAKLEVAYKNEQLFVFIMERLSGLDVLSYLSSFTYYNEETVSRIIVQVMDAIEYLHFRGMCLLELQPDNVVMRDGRSTCVKLVDFSSARFVPRSGARVPINASQSVEYCPPEVIANHEVSTASDVWCIGVLTYVMLSGFSPFSGETEEETRENVRLGRYKYDHLYGNCTPEVTRFLINVFKKHSSSRPTIEQLYENKWLLPNDFMIRKRQHATFRTDKIVAFAEQFHKLKKSLAGGSEQVSQLLSGDTS